MKNEALLLTTRTFDTSVIDGLNRQLLQNHSTGFFGNSITSENGSERKKDSGYLEPDVNMTINLRIESKNRNATPNSIPMPGQDQLSVLSGTGHFSLPSHKSVPSGQWTSKLDSFHLSLAKGLIVADIGCGRGASTLLMACRYPKSNFYGIDSDRESVLVARDNAYIARVENAFFFERLTGANAPSYDLIRIMQPFTYSEDQIHTLRETYKLLKKNGSILLNATKSNAPVGQNSKSMENAEPLASKAPGEKRSKGELQPDSITENVSSDGILQLLEKIGFLKIQIIESTPIYNIIKANK